MSNKFTEFNLPTDAYTAFDASSLKRLIIDRLTSQGVLTDQVYEGSNLSSIIDIISYSYHVLLFYLNRTANESMFSQADIYENMNRIVKLINYKPLGNQTSVLPFTVTAEKTLTRGIYTLPRYSFIEANGVSFSFNQDITFSKLTSLQESLDSVAAGNLLYQGKYTEYPEQIATGEPFELFTIALDKATIIDHNSIDVYVNNSRTGAYQQYTEMSSLYLADPDDRVYEKRFNENGRYEITFGNNINGAQLNPGDSVHIVYLKTDGKKGEVGVGAINGKSVTLYTSVNFSKIRSDVKPDNIEYMSFTDVKKLKFMNAVSSTTPDEPEDISTIRKYAPEFFKTQNRLVTAKDYEIYIKRNYGNILNDVAIVSNDEFISGHLTYLDERLGLGSPSLESRVLYNQVNFADANNFNNIHIYAVPKVIKNTSATIQTNFLAPAQKELLQSSIREYKMVNAEPVFQDPVYMAVGLGVLQPGEELTVDIKNNSTLVLERSPTSKKNGEEIKQQAYDIILDYFSHANSQLGGLVDISHISGQLMSLEGVQAVYMSRTDSPTLKFVGLSLLLWNPVYSDRDIELVNQNIKLPIYKYPYLYDEAGLLDLIQVTQALG
jgi:hypothetical protein